MPLKDCAEVDWPTPACLIRMPSEKPVILILEDEAFIALDLESALNEGGFSAVVLASCAEGETFLAAARPDAAVLDVLLKDGECSALAKTLVARGVPFIVHTGSDPVGRDEVFSRGIAFGKPSDPDDIVAAVEAAIAVTSNDEDARDALTAIFGKSPIKKG